MTAKPVTSAVRGVLHCLLSECWTRSKTPTSFSSEIGYKVMHSAFASVEHYLSSEDTAKQQLMSSLSAEWSHICVSFAIAGHIQDAPEQSPIRRRLSLYQGLEDRHIVALQKEKGKATDIIHNVLRCDTRNIIAIAKACLFPQSRDADDIISLRKAGSTQLTYTSDEIWAELVSPDMNLWDLPASTHKLMFQLYEKFAIYDHFAKYRFTNVADTNNHSDAERKAYTRSCAQWMSRIQAYFAMVLKHKDLAQMLLCRQSVVKYIVSAYIASGNCEIRSLLDKLVEDALNDKELVGQRLPAMLHRCVTKTQIYISLFADQKEYSKFERWISVGVMMSIESLESELALLSQVQTTQTYRFAVPHHVVSVMAHVFEFMDSPCLSNVVF